MGFFSFKFNFEIQNSVKIIKYPNSITIYIINGYFIRIRNFYFKYVLCHVGVHVGILMSAGVASACLRGRSPVTRGSGTSWKDEAGDTCTFETQSFPDLAAPTCIRVGTPAENR